MSLEKKEQPASVGVCVRIPSLRINQESQFIFGIWPIK